MSQYIKSTTTNANYKNNSLSISKLPPALLTAIPTTTTSISISDYNKSSPTFNNSIIIKEDDYESLQINIAEIKSSLYDYELFAMMETIKDLMINSLGIPEELFNETYNNKKKMLEQFCEDKLTANKILNKLSE